MEAKFIVFVLFVLFSIAKSIAQKVKAANEKQQRQIAAGVPPADRAKVQSEIEAFLSSVRAGQGQLVPPAQQGRQLQQPMVAAPVDASIRRLTSESAGPSYAESRQQQQRVLDDRQRELDRKSQNRSQNDQRQNQGQPRSAKKQNRKQQDPGKRKQNQGNAGRLQERSTQNSGVSSGTSVSQHVSQHMRSHLADDVRADLGVGLPRSVGSSFAPAETPRQTSGAVPGAALVQALRNPDGVRQAIVIAEILSRPKALRKSNG